MSIKELSFLLIQHGVSFDCKNDTIKAYPYAFSDNYDTLTVVGGEVFINGEKIVYTHGWGINIRFWR